MVQHIWGQTKVVKRIKLEVVGGQRGNHGQRNDRLSLPGTFWVVAEQMKFFEPLEIFNLTEVRIFSG